VRFAQHFCTEKLLVVNSIFNTNKLQLPLLTSVKVINTGKTFSVVLFYCSSETAASYNFFFNSLYSKMFTDSITDPEVIIENQTAGLILLIDIYNSILNSQL
jgi:hypothetical protein